jgi:hypothetical protein
MPPGFLAGAHSAPGQNLAPSGRGQGRRMRPALNKASIIGLPSFFSSVYIIYDIS